MALKIRFPSDEDKQFCEDCNGLLKNHGARVSAYEILHPDDSVTYHLTFECGSKRKSISSSTPWYYEPPNEVVQKVLDWIHGARQAARWTTELPSDLED